MLMRNFSSPTLKRTFPEIYFGVLSGEVAAHNPKGASPHGEPPLPIPSDISVPKAPGPNAFTVADIYQRKDKLAGTKVKVQGMVVKVNTGILERNWIHLRDGTGSDDKKDNDLILTSQQAPQIGTVVVASGKVATKRDFGSGYSYDVLVEEVSFAAGRAKR
jgi:hypothetical protein